MLQHNYFANCCLITHNLNELLLVFLIYSLRVNAFNAKAKRKTYWFIVLPQATIEEILVLLYWLLDCFWDVALYPDVDVADMDIDVM